MTTFGPNDASIPPPPRPLEYREVDDGGWWVLALLGLVLVGVGVWMVANPFESVVVLAWLVGLSLIAGGVFDLAALARRDAPGWLGWIGGGLLILAGVVLLAWPDITLWVVAVIAGLSLLGAGAVGLGTALAHRDRPDWRGELGLGCLGMVLGGLILAWPEATVVVLAVLFGIRAIVTGLIAIGIGWQTHRLAT